MTWRSLRRGHLPQSRLLVQCSHSQPFSNRRIPHPMEPSLCAAARRNLSLLLHNAPRRTAARLLRHHSTTSSSVSSDELTHFASLASSWWDPLGPSRILHLMNPLRHDFIASCLSEGQPKINDLVEAEGANARDGATSGLRYLDIGCGGGIFAESLARTIPLKSSSTLSSQTNASSLLAIDPSPVMIEIAQSHARKDPKLHSHFQSGKFKYENSSLESLISRSASPTSEAQPSPTPSTTSSKFDIITIFEVIEHVDPSTSSPRQFIENCLSLLNPGGWLIGSTIARTLPSYFINQVIAEAPWPIGVVPPGTHEWSKFVNVDELRTWSKSVKAESEKSTEPATYLNTKWKCVGAVYFPGMGWKLVSGAETRGNYFWGIQRLASHKYAEPNQ